MDSAPRWVVWCPMHRWVPTLEGWHTTEQGARDYAAAQARAAPGAPQIVLRVVSSVTYRGADLVIEG